MGASATQGRPARFATWLEREAETSKGLIEQMEKQSQEIGQ
jgi:hypothetical protein